MDWNLSSSDPGESVSDDNHDVGGVQHPPRLEKKRKGFLKPPVISNFVVLNANNPSDDEFGRRNQMRFEAEQCITRNIILTPLEQNAPRRYKRIALLLPCNKNQSDLPSNEWMFPVTTTCFTAYVLAMTKWPFLTGKFTIVTRDPSQIRLRYSKPLRHALKSIKFRSYDSSGREVMYEFYQQFSMFEPIHKDQHNKQERHWMAKVNLDSIKRSHFMWENGPEKGESFRPISLTVKPTPGRDYLILAFEFSESIFDLRFINTFLRVFVKKLIKPKKAKAQSEFPYLRFRHCTLLTLRSVTSRRIPIRSSEIEARSLEYNSYD